MEFCPAIYECMKISSFILDRVNPRLLAMGIAAVFMGSACAVVRGNLEIFSATLTLVFVIFLQLAAQFLVAYNSLHGNKSVRHKDGSDLSTLKVLKDISTTLLLVAATIGISLLSLSNWSALSIGVVVVALFFLGYLISSPLSKKRLAIILTFLFFGPIGVIGTSLVQSSYESPNIFNIYDLAPSLWFCSICGLYAVNVHLIDNCREYQKDIESGVTHVKSLLSFKFCHILFWINAFIVLPIAFWGAKEIKIDYSWIFYLATALSFAFHIFIAICFNKAKKAIELSKIENLQLINILLFSILVFVIFSIVGVPDDSSLFIF